MTNRFRPKPNGRSWQASCAWIPRPAKAETQEQSHVLGFAQSNWMRQEVRFRPLPPSFVA